MGGRRPGWFAAIGLLLLLTGGCEALRVRIHLKDGNQLYNAQKYEQAIVEYQKILALEPDHWEANYLTAASYMALYHPGSTHPKDLEFSKKAIEAYEKCLTLKAPGDEQIEKVRQFYLGLLTQTNQNTKATSYLEGLLAKSPNDTNLINQLASLYTKLGDFPQAMKYYEMRASLEPNNKEAWYTIGVLCWDRSYHGEAYISVADRSETIAKGIQALEKALAIDPNYFDALSYINLIYREKSKVDVVLGNYQEAQQDYAKAEEYAQKAKDVRDKQAGAANPSTAANPSAGG